MITQYLGIWWFSENIQNDIKTIHSQIILFSRGPQLPMPSTCLAHAPWLQAHLPSSDPHLLVGQRLIGQGSHPQTLRLASQAVAAAQGVGSVAHVLRLPRHHRAIVCHGCCQFKCTSPDHGTWQAAEVTKGDWVRCDSGLWQSESLEILHDESVKLSEG